MSLSCRFRSIRRRLDDPLLFALLSVALFLLRGLPLGWAKCLATGLADIVFMLSRRDRMRACAQLRTILGLGSVEADTLARASFRHLAQCVRTLSQLEKDSDGIMAAVEIVGLEHLEAALARGRGVIWMTGHIGNWELMAARVAMLGPTLTVVVRRLRYPRLQAWLERFRVSHQVMPVYRGEGNPMRLLTSALDAGGIVGLLVDQAHRKSGRSLPFLGYEAPTVLNPAILALRTGAPVVVGTIRVAREGFHRIVIEGPLSTPDLGSEEERAATLMAEVNRRLGLAILQAPETWPWFHARWGGLSELVRSDVGSMEVGGCPAVMPLMDRHPRTSNMP